MLYNNYYYYSSPAARRFCSGCAAKIQNLKKINKE